MLLLQKPFIRKPSNNTGPPEKVTIENVADSIKRTLKGPLEQTSLEQTSPESQQKMEKIIECKN